MTSTGVSTRRHRKGFQLAPPHRVFRCKEDLELFCSIEAIPVEKSLQGVLDRGVAGIVFPLAPRNRGDAGRAGVSAVMKGLINSARHAIKRMLNPR